MNSRKAFAAAIRKQLGRRYKVIDHPRNLDAVETKRPVVMLIRTEMKPAANAQGAYLNEIAVWIIEPKTIDAEDALDDALEDVILALDAFPGVLWTSAERSTYGDDEQPAYRIQTTTVSTKE